jgi:hypothetical protein
VPTSESWPAFSVTLELQPPLVSGKVFIGVAFSTPGMASSRAMSAS